MLLQELVCKDQERLAEVSQVKAEFKDQVGHLDAARTAGRHFKHFKRRSMFWREKSKV